jgi:acyl-CoA synthetase (AMP-forming)/AMP-acid ligase II
MSRARFLVGDLAQRGRDVLGNGVALIDAAGTATSYAELTERVRRTAAAFAGRGMREGDRLAVLSGNSPQFLEALLAASLVGATVVPLNLRLRAEDMRFQVDDADVSFAVVQDGLREVALAAGILDRLHWVMEEDAAATFDPAPGERARPSGDSTLVQLYTSGTTGRPKGCLLTQRNWVASTTGFAGQLGLRPTDRVFTPLPFFHVAGLDIALSTLMAGGTVVLGTATTPAATWSLIREHDVTVVQILRSSDEFLASAAGDLASLRGIYGGPRLPSTVESLEPGFGLWSGYGSTELCGFATGADRALLGSDPGTIGRLLPGYTGIVADEEDQPVVPGEVGQLLVRGSAVTSGYWNLPDATEEALANGWFRTGDLVRADPGTGALFFVDRAKDMVKPGGENVYCVEVETVLLAHPDVVECAVIGVPDRRWGEAVKAVVVVRAEISAETLDAWCLERLASFKRPRWYEFVQALPRNALSKVVKPALRSAHDPDKCLRLAERS